MFCTVLICYWFCQSRSLVLCPLIRVFGSFCLRYINACLLCMHVCICMYSFATACIHCLRCTKICLIAIHVSGSWRNNGDLWRLSDKSNVNSNCCRTFFREKRFLVMRVCSRGTTFDCSGIHRTTKECKGYTSCRPTCGCQTSSSITGAKTSSTSILRLQHFAHVNAISCLPVKYIHTYIHTTDLYGAHKSKCL